MPKLSALCVSPLLPAALAALLLSACATQSPPPLAAFSTPIKLTVLHTNDHHGRFWKNSDGEYGMAARKTLLDSVRAEVKAAGGHTLLLDGGDVNTGVPESDTQDAEPDFKGMQLLGYDAMTFGNHEFDKPISVLTKQIAWAGFPMLSANIYKDGKRFAKPYHVFDRGGLKIAVVGLTTDDTNKMVDPANIVGIEFRKPAREAAALMPELKSQAHVVIAATHMGHYPPGTRGVNAEGDVEMAREVKGFDLIVGGHSQNPVCMAAENVRNEVYAPGGACKPDQQNGAWIVQAHEWGKYVGRADFEYAGGQLKLVKYQLIPINLKKTVKAADGKDQKVFATQEIAEDAAALAFLKPYQDKGRAALDVVVGQSDGKLEGERAIVRARPTNLGVFIASVMQQRTKADLAIMNAGGIRESLPAGALTYKDVIKVQPFGNMLAYVDMSGKELMDYLRAAASMTAGSGAFAQFSGVQMVVEGVAVKSATLKGMAIDPAKTYRLALNNFQANGGDGYPKLSNHPGYVNTGFVDADVMREYLSKNGIKVADFAPGDAVVRR
jgi:5'-nucleotidase / UDP-sugar diphosphatase